ncbi:isochorismatase family protein [Acidimicrobiaceae bacterium USS-CC1]|uniref:Isochorismatase family protein n=1 Tax=Acidiferrimicrobium australe TaxID=2664430 RepID=A0ABW9QQH2_9ACTN|nr:isochorismatase family protein [Acidiferrimicrobium australe]
MMVVDGKVVLDCLDELVDPCHTALVIIDMQRDFVAPDGVFGRLGVDLSMYPPMRRRLVRLLGAARGAGVLVVHVAMTSLPGRRSDSPAQIRFNLRMHEGVRAGGPPLIYTVAGTRGHEFVDELVPWPDEPVVSKHRSSAFWGTDLAMLLRSNGVQTVVAAGCTTEGCVESTARDALFEDFYTVVAEDGVASDDVEQHAASMLLMRHRFDLATCAQLAAIWSPASSHEVGDRERAVGSGLVRR